MPILETLQLRCQSIALLIELMETKSNAVVFDPPFGMSLYCPEHYEEMKKTKVELTSTKLKKWLQPWSNYPDETPTTPVALYRLYVILHMIKQWMEQQPLSLGLKEKLELHISQFLLALPLNKPIYILELEANWVPFA